MRARQWNKWFQKKYWLPSSFQSHFGCIAIFFYLPVFDFQIEHFLRNLLAKAHSNTNCIKSTLPPIISQYNGYSTTQIYSNWIAVQVLTILQNHLIGTRWSDRNTPEPRCQSRVASWPLEVPLRRVPCPPSGIWRQGRSLRPTGNKKMFINFLIDSMKVVMCQNISRILTLYIVSLTTWDLIANKPLDF